MKRAQKLLLWVGILTVCVAVVAYGATRDYIAQDLEAIKALGIPTTRRDLQSVSLGTGEDAAPLYKEFEKVYDLREFSRIEVAYSTSGGSVMGSIDPAESSKAKTEVYRAFEKATLKPSWSIGPTQPGTLTFATTLMFGGRTIHEMAMEKWNEGKVDEALTMMRAADRYLAHVEQNPAWRSFDRPDRGLLHHYKQMLEDSRSDPKKLRKLVAAFDYFPQEPDRRFSIARYFCMDAEKLKELKGDVKVDEDTGFLERFLAPRKERSKLAGEIRMWRKFYEKLPKAPADWTAVRDALVEVIAESPPEQPDPAKPWDRPKPRNIDRALTQCSEWGANLVQRRALYVEAKLLLERVETGKCPQVLPDFGEKSIDPFTGKQMTYRLEDRGGFMLRYGNKQDFF